MFMCLAFGVLTKRMSQSGASACSSAVVPVFGTAR